MFEPSKEEVGRKIRQRTVGTAHLAAAPLEQYRILAHSLERAEPSGKRRVLVVTSSLPAEGKTLTVANLALTLSGSYHRRVLLVDGDLRQPKLQEVLAPDRIPSTVAPSSESPPAELQVPLEVFQAGPTLWVSGSTESLADPIRTLSSPEMRQLIEWGRTQFDWVLIDSPPAGLLPDANILAQMADGVLLVLWAASTPYEAIRRAVASIGRDRLVGVVMNRVRDDAANGSLRYYGTYSK